MIENESEIAELLGALAATFEDAGGGRKKRDRAGHQMPVGGAGEDLPYSVKCGAKALPAGPKSTTASKACAILKSEKRILDDQKVQSS